MGSSSEFRERRLALAERMAAAKLDALLIVFLPNVRYLTGFTGSNGMALVAGGRVVLFTDPRYTIQAAGEVDGRVQICRGPLLPYAVAAIGRARCRRIGFEKSRLSFEGYQFLKERLPMRVSIEPLPGWVEQQRMVKSAAEIELIRNSVELNSRAFEQGVKGLRVGMRETDLAAELDHRMRRAGAEGPAFETIVASGARTALPHAQPTPARLSSPAAVLVDMGAFLEGYASDMTRMLFLGRPTARLTKRYRVVLEAQLAAIDAVRPGVTAAAVDRAARRVLARHGLAEAFVHSTGHGLGLEIHEPPRLGKKDKTVLRTGMTVTIEPGVYEEGAGGIRIEDTVVITRTGCEVLTPTPKTLDSLLR